MYKNFVDLTQYSREEYYKSWFESWFLFYLVFSPQPPSIPAIRDKDTLSGKDIFTDRIIIFQSDSPQRVRASNVRGKKGMDH